MMGGFVKIPRNIMSRSWYANPNAVRVFLHLVLCANLQESERSGVAMQRGQLIVGRQSLSAAVGLSEKEIRNALSVLQNGQEIKIQRTRKFSLVTLCKFDDFSGYQDAEKTPATGARSAAISGAISGARSECAATACGSDCFEGSKGETGPYTGPEQGPGPGPQKEKLEKLEKKNTVRNAPESSAAGAAGRTRKNGVKIDLEATFARFWDTFADKRGKEPAKRAWSKIKGMTPDLVELIIAGAQRYAAGRAAIVERGGTPKMAEGWLTDRRWEDEAVVPGEQGRGSCATCKSADLCSWRPRTDCPEWKPAGGAA